jgi:hypothetical protein
VITAPPARLLVASLALAAPASAQSVQAVRLTGASPVLDGRLTEEVWRSAPAATGFTQREPNEGAPAIERTEVRFAYDDDALWIGARMFSSVPSDIRALVTRRDREGSSEQIIVSLDTHRDRRTAYSFSVTPAAVRIDYYHPSDFETSRNYDYNPVWEAAADVDSQGWTAEIRIPFTQLRFNPGEVQEWGVNIVRRVPARNEDSYWVLVRRNETGWSSRMAALTGIRDIRPSRRIELLPYVAADSRFMHVTDAADPFSDSYRSGVRAGGDVKMGIGPNLTLDLTINPDFGQVEADPAEVNLSAYETFFSERRPFFLEGAQLFGGRGFYYSRRIGAPPPGRPPADYVEALENTTILGAGKLTGRLPSGLSVAALAAVTGRELASTFDTASSTFGEAVVAPRTVYAVASAQQEFGVTRSTFGGMATMVRRDLEPGSPLAGLLVNEAYSALIDGRLRWAGGMYDASAYIGGTLIRGDTMAIFRQQLSPRRYWQRPDAEGVHLDPTRRAMSGTQMGINHSRISGRHWLWDVDYWQESPGLEPNDMGSFGDVDERGAVAQIRYRETEPGKWYRNWLIGTGMESLWNYDGDRTAATTFAWGNATFHNFWRLYVDTWYGPRTMSDALTRGGPLMGRPGRRGVRFEVQNRAGARNGVGVEVEAERDDAGGWGRELEFSFSFRPGARWEMTLDPGWERWEDSRQFVTSVAGDRPETFGRRYVFAHVDRSEVAARFRLNYTFTPNLTLETYAEPFASSGRFHGFGELPASRSHDLLVYGSDGSTTITRNDNGSHTVTVGGETFTFGSRDFNVRSFRSNAVMRWEWRPGSTLYLVWQQDRSASRALRLVRPGDLFDALGAPGDNFLALKVSYWIPLR